MKHNFSAIVHAQECLERIAITQELKILAELIQGLPSNPRFPDIAEKNARYLDGELRKRLQELFPGIEPEPIDT